MQASTFRTARLRSLAPAWLIAFAVCLLGVVPFSPGSTAHAAIATAANAGGVNIDAGGSGDATFQPDEYYSGGLTADNQGQAGNLNWPGGVAHPIPVSEWNTYRYLDNTYQVPALTPGAAYQVRLYFLDWYFTQVGQRVFDVAVNGAPVLSGFDIVQAAGNLGADGTHQGIEKDFAATADANGGVTIAFTAGSADQPLVNAISVVPGS
jgi:hypothetical protein